MKNLKPKVPVVLPTRQYVRRIETQLKKALEGFLEVGRILADAKGTLDKRSWLDMINNDLPFTRRTAEKFIKIAADPRLNDPAVLQKLPPKWTSLHELTFLDDDQFEQGISSGVINPDAERKDIKALRIKPKKSAIVQRTAAPSKTPNNNRNQQRYTAQFSAETRGDITTFAARDLTLAVVHQPDAIAENELLEFGQEFESLCRKYGLEPEFSGGFEKQELLAATQKRLVQKYSEFRNNSQSNPTALIEDAFFQLETGTKFALMEDGSLADNDLRNPSNQFHDMELDELYGYCLDLQLLTKYTPIEFLDVQSFCDVQAIQVLTGSPREREIAFANLKVWASDFGSAKAMLEALNG